MKKKLAALLLLSACFTIDAQRPSIGGYTVYYGDLHNHSNVSDGTGSPATAYNYAKNTAKLDFFSLADHSGSITSTEWADIKNQANAYNQDGVFTAFYGFEWSSNAAYGHVAVINSDDYCTTSAPTNTFAGLVNWLDARSNVVAFFNHPGRENDVNTEFSHFATTPSDKLVGIEFWNKGSGFGTFYYNDGYYTNDNNKSYFDEANSRGWKVGAAGGGDNHDGTWGTVYPSRLAILANALTRTDLLAAMKARRFFTTMDKNIALSFKINGNEMGSTVAAGSYTANILAIDGNGEAFTEVKMFDKNHNVVRTITLNTTSVNESINLSTTAGDYYYVKVKQADGNEAVSSPIYISESLEDALILQAEDANYSGAIVASNQEGYHGSGFIDYTNATGDQITWTVNVSTAGAYSLSFRYALLSGSRPLELIVNGAVKIASLDFPVTNSWSNWNNVTSIQSLNAGNNTITLSTIGSNGGNIDELVVTKVNGPITLQAEDAVYNGPVFATNHAGYNGTGFLDFVNASNDYIEWTVNVPTSANYTLSFRYAMTASRSLELKVNGIVKVASLAFPSTGSNTNWSNVTSYRALIAGNNKIRLTAVGSSGPNIDELVVTGSGLKSGSIEEEPLTLEIPGISVYPNPVNNVLNIVGVKEQTEVVVKNINGQTVIKTKTNGTVDVSNLVPGIYILSAGENKPVRFIKN